MRKPDIEEDNCRRSVFIITQPVSEQQAWTLREFLHRLSCCNCLYVVSKIQGEMDKNHTNRPRTILSILAKLVAQFLLGCCGIGACPGSMVRRLASPHNKKCVSWHILPKNPWSASNDRSDAHLFVRHCAGLVLPHLAQSTFKSSLAQRRGAIRPLPTIPYILNSAFERIASTRSEYPFGGCKGYLTSSNAAPKRFSVFFISGQQNRENWATEKVHEVVQWCLGLEGWVKPKSTLRSFQSC